MSLARAKAIAVGSILTPINSAVPASTSWTVAGMSICNKSTVPVSVDLLLRDTAPSDTYILYNFLIPPGETLWPIGNLGKETLLAGDQYFVRSVNGTVDVLMSYYAEAA